MNDRLKNNIPMIALAIALIFIILFRGIPLLIVVIRSFHTNLLDSQSEFIGIANYLKVVNDSVFWEAFCNSLLLLLYIPCLFVVSFLISTVIHDGLQFSELYKTIIVFPQVVATTTIASLFGGIFGYSGPANALLGFFNIVPYYWLGSKASAIAIIILCIIYSMFGWQTLIFSGALSNVDPNIKALVFIDGVSTLRRIVVYAHAISKTIVFSLILNIIYGIAGFFPIVYTLTKGGPGYQTTTVDFLVYLRAFKYGGDLSGAYTMASLLLFGVITLVGILYITFEKKDGIS